MSASEARTPHAPPKGALSSRIESVAPLTPMQAGMVFDVLLDQDSRAYVLQHRMALNGALRPELIKQALHALAARHPILRTLILHRGVETPVQAIVRDRDPDFVSIDLSALAGAARDDRVAEITRADLARGFDLQTDPLLRVSYLHVGDDSAKLVWTMHHVIVDGWCASVLFADFVDYYRCLSTGMAPEELNRRARSQRESETSFHEYVRWLGAADGEQDLAYWDDLLAGLDRPTPIEAVGTPTPDTGSSNERQAALSVSVTSRLAARARESRVTLNTMVELAWGLVVQRYCATDDVVFGKVTAGRDVPLRGMDTVVGLFINTIPIRVTTQPGDTVAELLERIQHQAVASSEHSRASLAEIGHRCGLGADLVSSLVVFENMPVDARTFGADGALACTIESVHQELAAPLALLAAVPDGCLRLNITYDPRRYGAGDVELLSRRLVHTLEVLADGVDVPVREVQICDDAELRVVLGEFNTESGMEPCDETLVTLFEGVVRERPDDPMLLLRSGSSITYRQVNEAANHVAARLRACGVGPESLVAIHADRRPELIAALYGILKSGGAYVPLDPAFPVSRRQTILDEARPAAVVVVGPAVGMDTECPVITVDPTVWDRTGEPDPPPAARPGTAAYCLFTSGTTGRPKGVVVTHRSAVVYCRSRTLPEYWSHDSRPVMVSTTNYCFDIFGTEALMAPVLGIPLVLASDAELESPAEFNALMRKTGASIIQCTPSRLDYLTSDPGQLDFMAGLSIILTGGEPFSAPLMRRLAAHTDAVWANVYGPTEATIFATARIIDDPERLDIGRPLAGYSAFVMSDGLLCGVGLPGELCLGGPAIARGYLGQPELTASRFVENPFGEGRLYRTGDIATWRPDGCLEFRGRRDDQIKIRGLRIELGEIQHAICQVNGVRDAVVLAESADRDEPTIIAYYLAGPEVEPSTVLATIERILPRHMIPGGMARIDAFPVNRAGKLDRRALPPITASAPRGARSAAARDDLERGIADVFCDILGVDEIGVDEDFFRMGGHSLRAARAANRIEMITGVRIALKEFFAHPTVEGLARAVRAGRSGDYERIPSAGGPGTYPASAAQRRIFALEQLGGVGTGYHLPGAVLVEGDIDHARLSAAFATLVERHEALRTGFVADGGSVRQVVADRVPTSVGLIEVDERLTRERTQEFIDRFIRPFVLDEPSLIRVTLVRGESTSALLLDVHHIVADGSSLTVIAEELLECYAGNEPAPVAVQQKDHTVWMESRNRDGDRAYWDGLLSGSTVQDEFPTDRRRPARQSYAGSTTGTIVGHRRREGIARLARDLDVSEYSLWVAAVHVVLSRYVASPEVITGCAAHGRTHAQMERSVGMFVTTLPIVSRPEPGLAFEDYVRRVHDTCQEAFEHQDFPFEDMVRLLPQDRDPSRNPVFDVMVALNNTELAPPPLPGAAVTYVMPNLRSTKLDLTVNIGTAGPDGGRIDAEFSTTLYDRPTVDAFLLHLLTFVDVAIARPAERIGDLDMVDSEERAWLGSLNPPPVAFDTEATVSALFRAQVAVRGNKTAVVCGPESVSYRDLEFRALAVSAQLTASGVGPGDFVLLAVPKGIRHYVALLGIAMSGAAWVPVDPRWPVARTQQILDDSRAVALVCEGRLGVDAASVAVVDVLDCPPAPVAYAARQADPSGPAYCIYTSGTTGAPKGVVISHRGVSHLLACAFALGTTPEDHWLGFALPVFDASIFELAYSVLLGATLHVAMEEQMSDVEWLNAAIRERVTVATLPPSLIPLLDVSPLRLLLSGGSEAIGPDDFHGRFVNAYGPTEVTVCATAWTRPEGDGSLPDPVPIGRALPGKRVHVVDGAGRIAGVGVPGELVVAGEGLAIGYLHDSDRTSELFVAGPNGERRVYRTGDRARWTHRGELEFRGRTDRQVKVRGVRIEPGEVEAALRSLPGVLDAAVSIRTDPTGSPVLCGYYVGSDSDPGKVRLALTKQLPDSMIPTFLTPVPRMPLNSSGKIDYLALPEPELAAPTQMEELVGPVELAVAEAFAEALGAGPVGATADFFALGGDSIKAIGLVGALRERGWRVSVQEVMTGRTVGAIATMAVRAESNAEPDFAEMSGPVGLSPIQRRFFAARHEVPSHFNQALVVRSTQGFDPEALRAAMTALTHHHDMLRATYAGGVQVVSPADGRPYFSLDTVDVPGIVDPSVPERRNLEAQRSMNLEAGPLFRGVLYRGAVDGDHLFLGIHHLVIDGVSWRILLADLASAYRQALTQPGGPITLPPRTAPFRDWVEALDEFAVSSAVQEQADYWAAVAARARSVDPWPDHVASFSRQRRIEFDADVTRGILRDAIGAYSAEPVELILCALGQAIRTVTGLATIAIEYESHGRHPIHRSIDTTRTVGWFTSLFPLVLDTSEDIGESIITAKESLRSVPGGGLGYALLLDAPGAAIDPVVPSVCFNYLGEMVGEEREAMGMSAWPTGAAVAPANKLTSAITVNAAVTNGCLGLDVWYDAGLFRALALEELERALRESVDRIVAHCAARDMSVRTASDFAAQRLRQTELGEIADLFS